MTFFIPLTILPRLGAQGMPWHLITTLQKEGFNAARPTGDRTNGFAFRRTSGSSDQISQLLTHSLGRLLCLKALPIRSMGDKLHGFQSYARLSLGRQQQIRVSPLLIAKAEINLSSVVKLRDRFVKSASAGGRKSPTPWMTK
jgi:hypothetical protein